MEVMSLSRRRMKRNIIALTTFLFIIYLLYPTLKFYMIRTAVFVVNYSRPLWDTDTLIFKNRLVHYNSDRLTGKKLCSLNNLTVNANTNRKIIDAFIFSVELDLLEIRLHELYEHVDKFIIMESNLTFTGMSKPLLFKENKSRFAFAKDKIVYQEAALKEKYGNNPFENEILMRNTMKKLVESVAKKGDLIINSDVDEIPSRNVLKLIKACEITPVLPLHLQMRSYQYSFEFARREKSIRPCIHEFNQAYDYNHHKNSENLLVDAGWHCSFCFRYLSDVKFKMLAYSHNDRVHHPSYYEKERIQKYLCSGMDIFDMPSEFYSLKGMLEEMEGPQKLESMIHMPVDLLEHSEKYKFLLPGGCIREDYSVK